MGAVTAATGATEPFMSCAEENAAAAGGSSSNDRMRESKAFGLSIEVSSTSKIGDNR
jgi:hypothetical protein